jgi:DNA-binding XRE family transcriptional regulator
VLHFVTGMLYNVTLTFSQGFCVTKREKLKRWRELLAEMDMTVKEVAERFGIAEQTAYNWNCGSQEIPDKRLEQLEALA